MTEYTIGQILALEEQVWAALVAGDPAADARALSDDFLGVYSTGFADRTQHAALLDNGPIVADYQLSDVKMRVLADDVVLLTYAAVYSRRADAAETSKMYVSSIWQKIDGVWKNIFSQDTDADE